MICCTLHAHCFLMLVVGMPSVLSWHYSQPLNFRESASANFDRIGFGIRRNCGHNCGADCGSRISVAIQPRCISASRLNRGQISVAIRIGIRLLLGRVWFSVGYRSDSGRLQSEFSRDSTAALGCVVAKIALDSGCNRVVIRWWSGRIAVGFRSDCSRNLAVPLAMKSGCTRWNHYAFLGAHELRTPRCTAY